MKIYVTLLYCLFLTLSTAAQTPLAERTLSGVLITSRDEPVAGATITVGTPASDQQVVSDATGAFRLSVPRGALTVRVGGKNIVTRELTFSADDPTENLRLAVEYLIPPIHDSLVISATLLDPLIDRRNDTVYRNTLFTRDDQVFHTLDAGINAGQHEGGGKSLEIRRFGFNLDHGGVNGGLKVLVDNFQQNQGTQGHGQGYLGQLKSLTPELVADVEILNGPFSAEYGDFSSLGVVQIRLKESLVEQFTARLQGGSFNSYRAFLAYSPELRNGSALLAYEGSRTDGPFINPLDYQRDNLSGNYLRRFDERRALGFKFNIGRNDFISSGQIPLDEVYAGRLDRFGFIDPDNGGRVRTGVINAYYKHELEGGSLLKFDGFVARSLFDLYSNFTFFLNDELNGDEIQQHDSRLQEGANAQFLRPHTVFGQRALLTVGGNYHDNQINVSLNNSIARIPISVATKAHARVTNAASYAQQGIDLWRGRLHVEGGVRYDYFRFRVNDLVDPTLSGVQGATRVQPKFNLSVTPSDRLPLTVYFNYGRGIASQDARGVVQQPGGERISTTDFYQFGTSHNLSRLSLTADLFLIDRSNEQVYIPDDGSFELRGPSRAYGFEVKTSIKLTRFASFNGGFTRVMNAFFRGTAPRLYVDSAPHFVSNAALTLAGWHGFSGSLRYRHVNNYRLDGADPTVRAAGFDVLDLNVVKQVRRWLEFNFAIDNLTDKRYFETQNYFESRLRPGLAPEARIHATPGYPFGVSAGLTFRLGAKD